MLNTIKSCSNKKKFSVLAFRNNKERIGTDRLQAFIVNAKPPIKSIPKDHYTKISLSEDDHLHMTLIFHYTTALIPKFLMMTK